MSLTIPGAPKSSPGDRPLFKGLSTDPYLRAFFRGLEGSENFFNSFLTPTESLAFERITSFRTHYIYIALYIALSDTPKTPFLSRGRGRSFLFFLAFESGDIKKARGE